MNWKALATGLALFLAWPALATPMIIVEGVRCERPFFANLAKAKLTEDWLDFSPEVILSALPKVASTKLYIRNCYEQIFSSIQRQFCINGIVFRFCF